MSLKKIDDLREDIWRGLNAGKELDTLQTELFEKYKDNFSSIVIAANVSVICRADFVGGEIPYRQYGIISSSLFT